MPKFDIRSCELNFEIILTARAAELLHWIKCYLTFRYFYVQVKDSVFFPSSIYGVPQGYVLGPYCLFSILNLSVLSFQILLFTSIYNLKAIRFISINKKKCWVTIVEFEMNHTSSNITSRMLFLEGSNPSEICYTEKTISSGEWNGIRKYIKSKWTKRLRAELTGDRETLGYTRRERVVNFRKLFRKT